MKVKLLLLLIIPIFFATEISSAVDMYNKNGTKLDFFGKVNSFHNFSESSKVNHNQNYMHIGLKGESQINDQINGYGQWQYQIIGNTSEIQIAYVGIKFDNVGSLDYGRNYGVVYDVTSWINVLPEFSGNVCSTDNFMQQKGNGFVTYRNNEFFGLIDGLNFAIQYQSKNDNINTKRKTNNDNCAVLKQNGNGIGGSLTYDLGEGFTIGGAISHSKRTKNQNNNTFGIGNYAETYTSSLKYNAKNIYLATQYTQTYNATRIGDLGWANKAKNFGIVAKYQSSFGLRPSFTYLCSKGTDLDHGYGNQDLMKHINIGATYFFNKNTSTYFDYKINLINKNDFTKYVGITTDNVLTMGLSYQF